MRRILAILNARAGTFLDGQVVDPVGTLRRAFAAKGDQIEIVLAKPRAIGSHLARAATSDHDTVIIGGGDGTVNRAIEVLGQSGKVIGVLPLGTINVLARDLGIPLTFPEAVATLAQAEPQQIDIGTINGKPFHSVCGLGYFAQVARARERLRDLSLPLIGRRIAWALSHFQAFRQSGRFSIAVDGGDGPRVIEAYAVLATVNRFEGADWRRPHLDGGLIEIHVARDVPLLRRVMLGRDLATGAWRDNPDIETFSATHFEVGSRRSRRWVTRDGELTRERMPMQVAVGSMKLSVLKAGPAVAD